MKLLITLENTNKQEGKQSYTDPLSFSMHILSCIPLGNLIFTLILYFVRYCYSFIIEYIKIYWTHLLFDKCFMFFSFGSGNIFVAKFLWTCMFISLEKISESENTGSKNINILNKCIFSNCLPRKIVHRTVIWDFIQGGFK